MNTIIIKLILLTLLYSSAVFASSYDMKSVGTGEVNYLGFIKVYDAELVAPPGVPRGLILSENTPKCLILNYEVSLKAEDLVESAETILQRQQPAEILDTVRSHIDNMHGAYSDIRSGDSYSLCYDNISATTTLSLNKREVISIISPVFSRVYFGIWLAPEKVLDESLRDSLLRNLTL